MLRRVMALALLVLICLIAGCGGVKAPPATPPTVNSPQVSSPTQSTQSTQQTPAAAPAVDGFYPPDTRTGIAAVDGVIEAVMSDKSKALAERYQPVTLACLKREWQGAPLCPADKPAGTPTKAYPTAYCNLGFKPDQSAVAGDLESALGPRKHLFAVYKAKQVPGLDKAAAAYAAVFGTGLDDNYAPTVYLDKDGNLLLLRWGCGMPELAVPSGAEVVLAPKVTASEGKRQQAEAEQSALVVDEVRRMYNNLRAVLGEYDACAGATLGCVTERDLAEVVDSTIMRCDKVGPEAQMSGYGYNDQRQGPVFRPYRDACNTLINAQDTIGKPALTAAWREKVLQARQLLDPAIKQIGGPVAK